MAITKKWKVYGAEGHRQRLSFAPSAEYNWSDSSTTRIIALENADKTGTNDYTRIIITRDTFEECLNELRGQISDGFFENCRVGKIELEKE